MKTSFRRAVMAIAVLTGLHLPAAAGVLIQDITPAARLGAGVMAGPGTGSQNVVPMPALLLPAELLPTPVPMPGLLPNKADEPATVPEPGTVATFGAGIALMFALARRRRPARLR